MLERNEAQQNTSTASLNNNTFFSQPTSQEFFQLTILYIQLIIYILFEQK